MKDLPEICCEIVAAKVELEDLEDRIESVKERMKDLQEEAIREMERTGVSEMVAAGRKVKLRRELWAKLKAAKSEAIRALRESGLENMVYETYNSNTVSAFIRHLPRDDEDLPILPPELEAAFDVSEKFSIRVTGG